MKFWNPFRQHGFFHSLFSLLTGSESTPYDVKKALGQIEEYADDLRTRSDRLLCVGGDHTISYGLLASAAKQCKAGVCLIHFDTHLDTSESYFRSYV